jgi:hypothetical protein
MAKLPTPNEIRRKIFDAVATYGIRAGDTFPITGVQMKLHPEVTADEYSAELQRMASDGLIQNSNSPTLLKLTEAGFNAM